MIMNFIRSAARNLLQHKVHTVINIVGLSVGIASCLIVAAWVSFELSYDQYHPDHERIFRVALDSRSQTERLTSSKTSAPLVSVLRENFPQIDRATQYLPLGEEGIVRFEDKSFYEGSQGIADPQFFDFFEVPFIRGNRSEALKRPYTVVITEDIARKYFGHDNPVGQTLTVNRTELEVTGLVPDVPPNSHLKYKMVMSLATITDRYPMSVWGLANFFTYVKLKESVNPDQLTSQLASLEEDYVDKALRTEGEQVTYFLQPIADIHLESHLLYEAEPPGNPAYLIIFSLVGILVLTIACINFVNLTTARAANRAREVGVRKITGASRSHLIGQFLVESMFVAACAAMLSLLLLELVFPMLSSILGIGEVASVLQGYQLALLVVMIVLFVGIGGGLYPALFISSFRVSQVLRGQLSSGRRAGYLRRLLVVFQFFASIGLMICALTVYDQISFMRDHELGFAKEQKLIVPDRGGVNVSRDYEMVRTELLKIPTVRSVTASSEVPGQHMGFWGTWPLSGSETDARAMHFSYVDHDFIPEYEIDLVAGVNFAPVSSNTATSDSTARMIVNATAAHAFGHENVQSIIGTEITTGFMTGTVVGVVADYHNRGLQEEIGPLVLMQSPQRFRRFSLTISKDDIAQTIASVEEVWKERYPDRPFSFAFLDEQFGAYYEREELTGRLFSVLTVLGMFVACIGLLGLASHAVERRTKEIGMRKVLGATIGGIVNLVSREFLLLVAIANLIAWPTAYWLMDRWLENFAYRTTLSWVTFVSAGLLAVVIAMVTVGYHAIKTATANPVEALKYE